MTFMRSPATQAAGGRSLALAAEPMTARRSTACVTTLPEPSSRFSRLARRQGWTFGVAVLLVLLLLWRFSQLPEFGGFESARSPPAR